MDFFAKIFKKKSPKHPIPRYCNTLEDDELRIKLDKKLHSLFKGQSYDMNEVEKLEKQLPTNSIYQQVKNADEYKLRQDALHYSMIGEYENAIDACNKGLEINPLSMYLLYMKGRTESDLGLHEEGLKSLTKAIAIKKDYADAYVERGRTRQKMGDMVGAIKDYEKADSIEPGVYPYYDDKVKPTLNSKEDKIVEKHAAKKTKASSKVGSLNNADIAKTLYNSIKKFDGAEAYGSLIVETLEGDIQYKVYFKMLAEDKYETEPAYVKLIYPDKSEIIAQPSINKELLIQAAKHPLNIMKFKFKTHNDIKAKYFYLIKIQETFYDLNADVAEKLI